MIFEEAWTALTQLYDDLLSFVARKGGRRGLDVSGIHSYLPQLLAERPRADDIRQSLIESDERREHIAWMFNSPEGLNRAERGFPVRLNGDPVDSFTRSGKPLDQMWLDLPNDPHGEWKLVHPEIPPRPPASNIGFWIFPDVSKWVKGEVGAWQLDRSVAVPFCNMLCRRGVEVVRMLACYVWSRGERRFVFSPFLLRGDLWDLAAIDPTWIRVVREIALLLAERGIILHLELFDDCADHSTDPVKSPYRANTAGKTSVYAYSDRLHEPYLLAVAGELGEVSNIRFGMMNEGGLATASGLWTVPLMTVWRDLGQTFASYAWTYDGCPRGFDEKGKSVVKDVFGEDVDETCYREIHTIEEGSNPVLQAVLGPLEWIKQGVERKVVGSADGVKTGESECDYDPVFNKRRASVGQMRTTIFVMRRAPHNVGRLGPKLAFEYVPASADLGCIDMTLAGLQDALQAPL